MARLLLIVRGRAPRSMPLMGTAAGVTPTRTNAAREARVERGRSYEEKGREDDGRRHTEYLVA